jgi:hypothetical protein
MNLSLEEKQDILTQASRHSLETASILRGEHKIKRGQYLFHPYSMGFTIKGKYVGVIIPLLVERKDTKLLYQPVVEEITEDDFLNLVKPSK